MSHFSKVVNGIVTDVIVADETFFETFIDTTPGEWIKTSFNTSGGKHYDPITREEDGGEALRMNFGGIGCSYDAVRDVFIPIKVFESWTLNEDTILWEPPVARPVDDLAYNWNEDTLAWDEFVIPTEQS